MKAKEIVNGVRIAGQDAMVRAEMEELRKRYHLGKERKSILGSFGTAIAIGMVAGALYFFYIIACFNVVVMK